MSQQPPQDPFNPQDPPQFPGPPYQGQPVGGQPVGGQPVGGQPVGGQPFGPPPGSQPAYYGGYSPPGWQPRRRRRRHRVRGGFIALGIFVVFGIVAVIGSMIGSHSSDSSGVQVSVTPFPAVSKLAEAQLGSAVVLTGNSAGEKVAVTVVKVFSHPRGATEFDTADQGGRLYAVRFRLDDTGSAAYSDAPSNGAVVVDSAGKSHQSSLANVADCASFPAAEHIAAGNSGLGCIVFDVPVNARITVVQFTLDSGFGPETGQWKVPG